MMASGAVTSETENPHDQQTSSRPHVSEDTVPSSPPLAGEESIKMAAPARKRSQDEMNGDVAKEPSNETHVSASLNHPTHSQTDKQLIVVPGTAAQTHPSSGMPPPPTPTPDSTMKPPAARPTRSAQANPMLPTNQTQRRQQQQQQQPTPSHTDQTSRAVPATAVEQHADDQLHDDTVSKAWSTFSNPEERIEDFDWEHLQQRYHDRMSDIGAQEQHIFHEFNELCEYFSVWADASRTHEVGRSFKRLKTQIAYVAHEEEELENKRQHYIKVVNAFKSALQLLGT